MDNPDSIPNVGRGLVFLPIDNLCEEAGWSWPAYKPPPKDGLADWVDHAYCLLGAKPMDDAIVRVAKYRSENVSLRLIPLRNRRHHELNALVKSLGRTARLNEIMNSVGTNGPNRYYNPVYGKDRRWVMRSEALKLFNKIEQGGMTEFLRILMSDTPVDL